MRKKSMKTMMAAILTMCMCFNPIVTASVHAEDEIVKSEQTQTTENPVPETEPTLVYGDEKLADKDAFVLMMVGDGFTEAEQEKFYDESKKVADYVMNSNFALE